MHWLLVAPAVCYEHHLAAPGKLLLDARVQDKTLVILVSCKRSKYT